MRPACRLQRLGWAPVPRREGDVGGGKGHARVHPPSLSRVLPPRAPTVCPFPSGHAGRAAPPAGPRGCGRAVTPHRECGRQLGRGWARPVATQVRLGAGTGTALEPRSGGTAGRGTTGTTPSKKTKGVQRSLFGVETALRCCSINGVGHRRC